MDAPKALLGFTFAHYVVQKKRDVSPFQQKSQEVFKSHAPLQSLWLEDAVCLSWGCNVLIDLSLGRGWSQPPGDHRDQGEIGKGKCMLGMMRSDG